MPPKKPPSDKPRRRALTQPAPYGGFVERTSRPLYTSRTRRGPLLAPSEKSDRLLGCESALESTFVAATRFDTRVERAYPQPLVMDVTTGLTAPDRDQLKARLRDDGYSPSDTTLWFVDFEIVIVGRIRPVYVEVKPAKRADKITSQLDARRQACERIGVDFMLVLDTDFPEPLINNIRMMQRYAGMPVAEQSRARVTDALANGAALSLNELVCTTGAGLAELYGLISEGHLELDLHAHRISPHTIVRASSHSQRTILKLPE